MPWSWPAAHPKGWLLVALGVLALNAWVLVHFHDRFWWAPDEGNYAHVAERILDGDVLHADVQDIHPGYVNFTNAAALALFGRELVSMRYPLVALGVVQCLIMFLVLRSAGLFTAAAARPPEPPPITIRSKSKTPPFFRALMRNAPVRRVSDRIAVCGRRSGRRRVPRYRCSCSRPACRVRWRARCDHGAARGR